MTGRFVKVGLGIYLNDKHLLWQWVWEIRNKLLDMLVENKTKNYTLFCQYQQVLHEQGY